MSGLREATGEVGGGDWLRRAFGDAAVREHPPLSVDGLELDTTLCPDDGPALANMLEVLSAHAVPVLVWGGGNRRHLGNPPRTARALLSTAALSEIDDFDADDGVVHAAAGATLAQLRACVNAAGWELPLDAAGDGASLGGVLAAAAIGPRRLGFGAPRNSVLGLEVTLPGGARTRCGGRVVKNVTGYDMAKLYTGSLGSLGVIEGGWLRLRRLPEAVVVRAAAPSAAQDRFALGLATARRPTARVAAMLSASAAPRLLAGTPPEILLVAEFAGDAAAVRSDAQWFATTCGGEVTLDAADPIALLRGLQGQVTQALRARLALLPSRLPAACAALRDAGLDWIAHPGLGLVYASGDAPEAEPRDAFEARLLALESTARSGGGDLLFEVLPSWAKRRRDVFGAETSATPLMRQLKHRFDPNGILNPGRFAGGL